MTAYAEAGLRTGKWQLSVTLRSLNGKYFDCSLRVPHFLESEELAFRRKLTDRLLRGKVSLSVQCTPISDTATDFSLLSREHFQKYWQAVKAASSSVGARLSDDALFAAVLRLPTVLQGRGMSEEEQKALRSDSHRALDTALQALLDMQIQEGQKTQDVLLRELKQIEDGLKQVLEIEPRRAENLQKKLRTRVKEALGEAYSEERLAQELFFYLERMDFSEEKERLQQHLEFFKQILTSSATGEAKRLIFISQEIGRELNTLGTKSHEVAIQQQIVDMKSALERIKEQLQNIK